MKKKLLTTFACIALACMGAIGLVACGDTADVTFGKVKGYYSGKNVEVAATKWTEVTTEEENVTKAYKLNEGQTIAYDATNLEAFGSAYVLAITVKGKGDVQEAEIKLGNTYADMKAVNNQKRTDSEGKEIKEKDYILFVTLSGEDKNAAKTIYLSIDWKEDKDGAYVYKFVIEKDAVTLGAAPEAA